MLYKRGCRKMCPCLSPDTPIAYFLQLRFPILWVKTKKVALVCEKFYQVTCHFSDCPRLRISYVDAMSGQSHFWLWAPVSLLIVKSSKKADPTPQLSGAWGIPSFNTLAVCKGSSVTILLECVPSVLTEHIDFVWVPMGLMVYHGQIGQKILAFPVVVSEWTQPLSSSGPFVYLSGCIQPFWPYPYY